MRFFKSKDVKIFPCSNRGTYTDSSKDLVFDPESRRASEYNFTHLSGRDLGKDSYVIGYDDANELLKVVLGGYYFEIHTKFSGLTFAQPEGNLGTYNLGECTLWLTLQKIAIANATSADSARSTQQLASLFSRVLVSGETYKNYDYYAAATDTTGELYHLTPKAADSEEGTTWWEIDPSCINLNTLDFPAIYRSDALVGSLSDQTPEYFCAAIGITSPGSAKPSLVTNPEAGYYPITSDAGEDLSGCLISLDLSKAENWLENIAASEFLYKEGEPAWVECKKHFQVDQLKATSQLETVKLKATGSSDLQEVTATTVWADVLKPNNGDNSTLDITATTISVGTISDVESLSAEAIVAETVTAETVAVPSMSDITITSTTPPTTLKAQVDGLISTADDGVKAQLIGDTILRAAGTDDLGNPITAITIKEDNLSIAGLYGKEKCEVIEGKTGDNEEEDWSDVIPNDLTLTGLKKEISFLTATGGEPNTIAELFVGNTKLLPTNKKVDLDQQLSIANLSDGETRVAAIEATLNGTTPAEGDPTIGLVDKVNGLEASIKNLDNIMNFRGIITPGDLEYLTRGCTGDLREDSDLTSWTSPITVEVGDVVIVRSKQDTDQFEYSANSNSYYNNTEFICTAVTETETTWQEIGTCDITDSLIREIIGEDTDELSTGSIRARLCAVEDLLDNIRDEDTEGTISYRIAAIEDAIGEDTGTGSIQGRLTTLETLTGTEGTIMKAIAANAEAIAANTGDIGDVDTPDTIIYRLTAVEATLSGTGGGADGDNTEGSTSGSLPDRVTALEGEVDALEANPIVAAAENLTLDQFKASIKTDVITDQGFVTAAKDAIIADQTFGQMVNDSLDGIVEEQTPGKVTEFIEDFATNDPRFTTAVGQELQKVNVADIEFPEDPEDPNSEKIKIIDKVTEAFSTAAAGVNLETLTFKPSPEGDDITIATAVSNAFAAKIGATDPTGAISGIVSNTFSTQITSQTSAAEGTVRDNINTLISNDLKEIKAARDLGNGQTVGTSVTTEINDIISSDIDAIADTRALSNDEKDTVGAAITSRLNSVIPSVIENHEFSVEQTNGIKMVISDQVTALITSTDPEDKYTFTAEQNNDITDLIEGQVTDLIERYEIADGGEAMNALSGLVNGLFQQAWVLYAVAFDGNGADSTTPMPMAAIKDCEIILPNNIERTGYKFDGWSTTESEADKVQSPYKVSANQILHAIWLEDTPETED